MPKNLSVNQTRRFFAALRMIFYYIKCELIFLNIAWLNDIVYSAVLFVITVSKKQLYSVGKMMHNNGNFCHKNAACDDEKITLIL